MQNTKHLSQSILYPNRVKSRIRLYFKMIWATKQIKSSKIMWSQKPVGQALGLSLRNLNSDELWIQWTSCSSQLILNQELTRNQLARLFNKRWIKNQRSQNKNIFKMNWYRRRKQLRRVSNSQSKICKFRGLMRPRSSWRQPWPLVTAR